MGNEVENYLGNVRFELEKRFGKNKWPWGETVCIPGRTLLLHFGFLFENTLKSTHFDLCKHIQNEINKVINK